DVSLVPANDWLRLTNKTVTGIKNDATINRQQDSDTIVVTGSVAKEGVLGPVTVRDPGLYFGHVLREVLSEEGIRVVGGVVREKVRHDDGTLPSGCHIVAIRHAPLADALSRAGKQSLGMMAEALLKLLGGKRAGVGSWESGRQAVGEFLGRVGVPPGQVQVDDGSGLSRNNRLSAAAATQVLRYMYNAPDGSFEMLRDSLACAGVDGTMEKRCRWPETKGRIFAKTGYIKGVRTLAGYIHTASDRWLAFAFFYNQASNPNELKKHQDEACRLLVNWPDLDA
ncbi:MAG: D-alanyl-D-alanine carboxypeptidase/D-alanyl-D-alanine-endopeptidase, partial [Dehalococcoidia bacterium]